MTTNRFRTHVLTVCLATVLLPVEVVLSQSLIAPRPNSDVFAFWDQPSVSPAQATADSMIAPWLRNTFVQFRAEGAPLMEPTNFSPSKVEPAPAPAEVPAVPVPGTVQNLRRADEH
jgi:hypothetical protein